MSRSDVDKVDSDLEQMYSDLAKSNVKPRWSSRDIGLANEPSPTSVPWVWKGSELRYLAAQAARLVSVDRGGDRRVLGLINPGHTWELGITATLWAGIQVLNPEEVAPAHRHTSSAFRFVIDGAGAYTVVNGERCNMSQWDLVLTPRGEWHDHYNEGDRPATWLDGLDTPLVRFLAATFFEEYPDYSQKALSPADVSACSFVTGGVVPGGDGAENGSGANNSPLLLYRWSGVEAALNMQKELLAPSRENGLSLRYVNPVTGGPILDTIDAGIWWLPERFSTVEERTVCSRVIYVIKGKGSSFVSGKHLIWESGDVIAVPSWTKARHVTEEGEAILMTYSDAPTLKALGLWRREVYCEAGEAIGGVEKPGLLLGTRL